MLDGDRQCDTRQKRGYCSSWRKFVIGIRFAMAEGCRAYASWRRSSSNAILTIYRYVCVQLVSCSRQLLLIVIKIVFKGREAMTLTCRQGRSLWVPHERSGAKASRSQYRWFSVDVSTVGKAVQFLCDLHVSPEQRGIDTAVRPANEEEPWSDEMNTNMNWN